MLERFDASDASAAMTGCRQMFEWFMSGATPPETDQTPVATVAAGSRKKEA